jgi:hypothetical protein
MKDIKKASKIKSPFASDAEAVAYVNRAVFDIKVKVKNKR